MAGKDAQMSFLAGTASISLIAVGILLMNPFVVIGGALTAFLAAF